MSRQDRWDLEPAPSARWWARHSTAISVGCVLVMMASAVLAVQSLVDGARQSALVWALLSAGWSGPLLSARGIAKNVRAYDERKNGSG